MGRRNALVTAGAALAAVLLLGCAGQSSPPGLDLGGEDGSGIIGGTEITPEDPLAASIVVIRDRARGANCTGTIVSPTLLVTAAHCIAGADPLALVVIFDQNLYKSRVVARSVVGYEVGPLWGGRDNDSDDEKEFDAGDIAIVRIHGALPRGYRPVQLLEDAAELRDGVTTTIAGYGVTNGIKKIGEGQLRKADVRVAKARFGRTEIVIDQSKGRGSCQGDSGGPAFIQSGGSYRFIGLISRGIRDPKNTCATYAALTNILPYKPWLQKAARQLASQRSDPRSAITEYQPQMPRRRVAQN